MRIGLERHRAFALLAMILLLMMLGMTGGARAESETNAGNFIGSSQTQSVPAKVERDAYVAGNSVSANDSIIGHSALLAGNTLLVENTIIGDSLRIAGNDIRIIGTQTDNNVTVAGNTISIDGNSTANAVYGAARVLTFRGTTQDINVYGETVILGGAINGNAVVYADRLVVEDGAKISGTLDAHVASDPEVGEKAQVGKIVVDMRKQQEKGESIPEQVGLFLMDIAYWAGATLIMGLLIIMFMGPTIERSVVIVRTHPIAVLVSGFFGIIIIPVFLVVFGFLYVTIPISIALFAVYLAICPFAVAFTGVSLISLIFPKMNRWITGIIGSVLLGIVSNIPYLGTAVLAVCLSYTIGYTICALYFNLLNAFGRKPRQKRPKAKA